MFTIKCFGKYNNKLFVSRCNTIKDLFTFYDYYKHFYYMKISINNYVIFNCGYRDKYSNSWIEKLLVCTSLENNKEILKIYRHIRLDFGIENIVLLGQKFIDKVNYI